MKIWKKAAAAAILGVAVMGTLSLNGCAKKDQGTIKIASKPMTEQYVLTEILGQLIEHDLGVKVEITKGVGGGTTNIQPALIKGDFDLYPEYTGTGWLTVLKEKQENDSDVLYQKLQEGYEAMGLHWSGLYGFQNSYALSVRREVADQYHLKTFTDLSAVSDKLVFGGSPDYMEREDGFPYLSSSYNLKFKDVKDINIALKYKAMADKQIDVTTGSTTDAQLSVADVTLLEDDKQIFATYYAGTVVRQDTLKKYPKLGETLEKLTGQISLDEMRAMNYTVEVDHKDEKDVARDFLTEKGLLK